MKGWPARLTAGEVTLRPIEISDQGAWRSARQRNAAWLTPWDATVPPGGDARPSTFRQLVRRLNRLARAGTTFPYPKGRSPVFYVGQSADLRHRLTVHRTYAFQAKSDRQLVLYWRRYEYAASYGCRFVYITTWDGVTARDLEADILARFATRFRSFPMTNSAGAWPRVGSGEA